MEHLHAVVARVGDGDQVAVGRPCRGPRGGELPVAGARRGRPELEGERAVGRVEHLHAVVARVGDGEHAAVRRPGHGARIPELAVGAAARPELANEAAVGAEHLHAVVARVGDGEHVARWRPCRRQGIPELAVGAAARPELANEAAVGAEHLHAVVARVGDGERAARRRGRQRRRGDGDILCTCA